MGTRHISLNKFCISKYVYSTLKSWQPCIHISSTEKVICFLCPMKYLRNVMECLIANLSCVFKCYIKVRVSSICHSLLKRIFQMHLIFLMIMSVIYTIWENDCMILIIPCIQGVQENSLTLKKLVKGESYSYAW